MGVASRCASSASSLARVVASPSGITYSPSEVSPPCSSIISRRAATSVSNAEGSTCPNSVAARAFCSYAGLIASTSCSAYVPIGCSADTSSALSWSRKGAPDSAVSAEGTGTSGTPNNSPCSCPSLRVGSGVGSGSVPAVSVPAASGPRARRPPTTRSRRPCAIAPTPPPRRPSSRVPPNVAASGSYP